MELEAENEALKIALRNNERRYHVLYDENPAMFFTLGVDGAILSVNRFAAEQLGYGVEDLAGMPLSIVHTPDQYALLCDRLKRCLQSPDTVHQWELIKLRKNGTALHVREITRVVAGDDGAPNFLVTCEDITEAHELSQQLSYQASHDALTSLVNRREFELRLRRVLNSARAEKTDHAMCYLDLDQFKVINDTCGHVAGDELLRQVAALLAEQVRKRDTLGRLGGDEFGVLMEHCSLRQARRVANALRKTIEDFHFLWEDRSFNVGVSIGLAPITETSKNTTSVLSAADSACYAAKDQGRNRIHVYHEDDAEVARRRGEMQWVSRIKQALEDERFHLSMQPITRIDERQGELQQYEVLLRMEDEQGNTVLPGVFLPAAERYNLAVRLDQWVIKKVFAWLTEDRSRIENLHLCFINLSGLSLTDEEFLQCVLKGLDRTRVPAEKICFEITETAAIANLASAIRFITALKQRGCRFALDDFGSGLSSFAYLKTLPVDFLKIDGVFVKDIVDDLIDFAMVGSINEIGQVMGKKTIAESVENEAILARLRELGVDYAQGYYLGRPQPIPGT